MQSDGLLNKRIGIVDTMFARLPRFCASQDAHFSYQRLNRRILKGGSLIFFI
jgi:hypothetical protein